MCWKGVDVVVIPYWRRQVPRRPPHRTPHRRPHRPPSRPPRHPSQTPTRRREGRGGTKQARPSCPCRCARGRPCSCTPPRSHKPSGRGGHCGTRQIRRSPRPLRPPHTRQQPTDPRPHKRSSSQRTAVRTSRRHHHQRRGTRVFDSGSAEKARGGWGERRQSASICTRFRREACACVRPHVAGRRTLRSGDAGRQGLAGGRSPAGGRHV